MRNKKIKWIVTIVLAVLCITSMANSALAESTDPFVNDDPFSFTRFDDQGISAADNAAQNIMGTGIQTVKIVGYGISIVMLLYIGIKYMLAAPSEKADLKKSLVIFVVGAVLVFAATTVLDVINNFATSNGLA